MTKLLSVIMMVLLSVQSIYSMEEQIDTLKQLNSVVITAKKPQLTTAITRTVIDSATISQSATSSLAEVIATKTPLYIKTYGLGSIATISFRGTAASHTKVKWNGVKINNPMIGQIDFSQLPIWMMDRVEIYHGGSSLVEGSGSLGGGINLYSDNWVKKPLEISLIQRVASFKTLNSALGIGSASKKHSLQIRYYYLTADNNFKFYNNAVLPHRYQKQKNAEITKRGVSTDFRYIIDNRTKINFHTWYHKSDRNLPTIMSYEGKGRNEKQNDYDFKYSLSAEKIGSRLKQKFTNGLNYISIDYLLANHTDLGLITNIDSRSSSYSYINTYQLNYHLSQNLELKIDANIDYHNVKTLNRITNEGYRANRGEFGVGATLFWNRDIFDGYIHLREEYAQSNLSPLMPSIGVVVNLDNTKNINFNITKNYNRPSLNDLYWLPGGNSDLKPEEGISSDISFNIKSKERSIILYNISSNIFISKIKNWILWRPSEFRYWRAENIREVLSKGIEINYMLKYASDSERSIYIHGNYGYTSSTNQKALNDKDKSVGKQLIYTPKHKASISMGVNMYSYTAKWSTNYMGQRFTTSENESTRHKLMAYTIHSLEIQKDQSVLNKKLNIIFSIDNILNKDYQSILWRAMPRRNYSLTLKLTI